MIKKNSYLLLLLISEEHIAIWILMIGSFSHANLYYFDCNLDLVPDPDELENNDYKSNYKIVQFPHPANSFYGSDSQRLKIWMFWSY